MKITAEILPGNHDTHQDWILLLEMATREVFDKMLSCKLNLPETSPHEPLDITAMVGMAGLLRGVLIVRCSRESGKLMASKMLGVGPDAVGPDLADALGEIANMIAGNFKNKIPGLDDGCMLTVPTVIIGKDYDLQSLTVFDTLELQLLFENQPLAVSLAIHSQVASQHRPRP